MRLGTLRCGLGLEHGASVSNLSLSLEENAYRKFPAALEIYKRNRNAPAAKRQEAVNRALQNAIRKAEKRPAKAVDR